MPRLFLAIDIGRSVRERAVELIEHLRLGADNIKWVARDQLHLTTNFLGGVPPDQIDAIRNTISGAVQDWQPFEIELRGAGAFPTERRPNILWLGVHEGAAALCRLQGELTSTLVPLGFVPEARPYSPHLTLGRLKRGGSPSRELPDLLAQHSDYDAGCSLVDELVLYQSELAPGGPVYSALHRLRLAQVAPES